MKLLVATLLVFLIVAGDPALCQQNATPASQSTAPTSKSETTPAPPNQSAGSTQGVAAQAQASPEAAPSSPNTLLDGTTLKLRLTENLSSETNKTGDQVAFEVTEEVDVQGVPVILKGAPALATVTNAEPKKRMGRGGKLDVNVDSVRLIDGEKAQLRAVKDNKGGGHVGAMTGAIVATSIVFFPAAPLFLLMHGKSVEIPKGTMVTAFVQGDMRLDLAKFVPATGATAENASAPAAASLTVESSVAGADIEVDGAFVGSTPSTVSITPGQHTITVKKKGYANWSRTMNVSGSAVRLNADLDPAP